MLVAPLLIYLRILYQGERLFRDCTFGTILIHIIHTEMVDNLFVIVRHYNMSIKLLIILKFCWTAIFFGVGFIASVPSASCHGEPN